MEEGEEDDFTFPPLIKPQYEVSFSPHGSQEPRNQFFKDWKGLLAGRGSRSTYITSPAEGLLYPVRCTVLKLYW